MNKISIQSIMRCFTLCYVGIVFLVANIFVSYKCDNGNQKKEFYKTLTKNLITKYEDIVEERRRIYFEGYACGLLLAFVVVVYANNNKRIGMRSGMCLMSGVTFITNYFYYILSKKSDSMVIHLHKEVQRINWQKINRNMQVKYHVGLILGIISASFFGASACS